jgi:hypothetical protein
MMDEAAAEATGEGGVGSPQLYFPQRDQVGCDGQRACIIVYNDDRTKAAQAVLAEFTKSVEDYAQRGFALVAVRAEADPKVERNFPHIRFYGGLEELGELRAALGLQGSLSAVEYNPRAYLVDPDGAVRLVSDSVRATSMWGEVTRALHAEVVLPSEAREAAARALQAADNFKADELSRQADFKEAAEWAQILKEDESLQMPSRWWLDGMFDGPGGKYLSASQQKLLNEAGVKPVVSAEGVVAPEWFAEAKARAEAKQKDEELQVAELPSGPGPAKQLVDAIFGGGGSGDGDGDRKEAVDAAAAAKAAAKAAAAAKTGDGDDKGPPPSQSVLERARLLALGLRQSGTSKESGRRLRLLRELEATVAELEEEGCRDDEILSPLKEVVATSWANAPAEALEEAEAAARSASRQTPASVDEQVKQLTDDLVEALGDLVPVLDVDFSKWKWSVRSKGKGGK